MKPSFHFPDPPNYYPFRSIGYYHDVDSCQMAVHIHMIGCQTGKDTRDNVQANTAAFSREIEDLRLQANGVLYCSTEDKRLGIWDKNQVASSQRRPPRLRRPVRRAGPRGLRARAADTHTASHV
jgi:hypothetical protein